MNYQVYTDGAYSMKNDEGAFAFIILCDFYGEVKRRVWKIKGETNNRAELKAIISAVWFLPEDATEVEIFSDSMYALKTLSGEWSRNANADLFESWERKVLPRRREVKMTFTHVKGHSGNYFNEECDSMCSEILGYDPSQEYSKYRKK